MKLLGWFVVGDGEHGLFTIGEKYCTTENKSYYAARGYTFLPLFSKEHYVDLAEAFKYDLIAMELEHEMDIAIAIEKELELDR